MGSFRKPNCGGFDPVSGSGGTCLIHWRRLGGTRPVEVIRRNSSGFTPVLLASDIEDLRLVNGNVSRDHVPSDHLRTSMIRQTCGMNLFACGRTAGRLFIPHAHVWRSHLSFLHEELSCLNNLRCFGVVVFNTGSIVHILFERSPICVCFFRAWVLFC